MLVSVVSHFFGYGSKDQSFSNSQYLQFLCSFKLKKYLLMEHFITKEKKKKKGLNEKLAKYDKFIRYSNLW